MGFLPFMFCTYGCFALGIYAGWRCKNIWNEDNRKDKN